MSIEEDYKLLLQKQAHQEKYDPGLDEVSMFTAPDIIGEGLGEEVFQATEGRSPEARATLATIARLAPDLAALGGSAVKGVYDAAKRGWYDDLPDVKDPFGQGGAIHGVNSKIFPDSWKGTKGKAWQMRDAGATPEEIRAKSLEETGYEIYFQNLYKDGKQYRADLKMNVPPINAKIGRRKKIANLDNRQDYPLKDFYNDPDLERGYPGLQESVRVSSASDSTMGGSAAQVKTGTYGKKGQNKLRFNEEYDDFMNSPDEIIPEELQHLIDDVERHPPGGNPVSDPNYANLSSEVDGRAMNEEWDTILDMRNKGMSPLEIRQTLQQRPLSDRFDTPDIFREVKARKQNREWEASTPDKDLIATHQLDDDRLDIAAYKKHLPNISLGIQRAKRPIPENEFGNSVLVGNKELIMPEEGMRVFNNDAYTSTYPSDVNIREHKLTDVKEFKTYEDIINNKEFMDEYFEAKAQRLIGVDEFPGAMIPKQSFEKLAPQLEKRGVKDIVPFEPGSGEYEDLLKNYFKYLHFGQDTNLDNIANYT